MKFTDLSIDEQKKARTLFEGEVREEIVSYLEECGEEVTEEFLKEEVKRITEASLEEEDDDWASVDEWYGDWFREYILAFGTVYQLYSPDE